MIFRNYIRKTCGFYVSEFHLVTMLLPHIVTKVEKGVKIGTILNNNIRQEIRQLISKLNINDIVKAKVLNINWNGVEEIDFSYIKEYMEEIIKDNNEIEIIINGTKEKIDEVNKNIEYWSDMNIDKIKGININIINCYEVSEFNSNINSILNEHEYIINTSGEYPVESMFEAHKRDREERREAI